MSIFSQILDLDDPPTHETSLALTSAFFLQARQTHHDMLRAHARGDARELAQLGHFLKGSACALGMQGLGATCQLIEQWGDEGGAEAMARIRELLGRVEGECVVAERWLRRWYAEED